MRYDLMAQEALRGVVREALRRVGDEGCLPGGHHFYIAFATEFTGVEMSSHLRSKYPAEMTIVIQHQFWNLDVFEDRFEVNLSFNKVSERLVVPFAAVRRFYDPSVPFGLQFQIEGEDEPAGNHERVGSVQTLPGEGPSGGPLHDSADDDDDAGEKTGEVVRLDAFRKK